MRLPWGPGRAGSRGSPGAPLRGGGAALAVALAAVAAVYAPVLGFGLVAEDFQFALKGAKVVAHPLELLFPFQLVWRPGVYALFALLVGVGGDVALWCRVAQLGAGLALAAGGWLVLRRCARFSPWLAAGVVVVWLASPLASEPLCGEASFLGHLTFGAALLFAVWLHAGEPSRGRRAALPVAVLLAAACGEGWVVLPLVFVAEDVALRGTPLRRAAWNARRWAVAVVAYLAAYGAVTHFRYAGVYRPGVAAVAAKAVTTLESFAQLSPPVADGFTAALASAPWRAAVVLAALGAVVAVAIVKRLRSSLLLLACGALVALPTLPIASQAGRWTFLPWFFFLAGVVAWLRDAAPAVWQRRPLRLAGAALLLALGAAGAINARGDVADWARFAQLTGALDGEAQVLLPPAARGRCLEVLRLADAGPWHDLVSTPRGSAKGYFPRPDDPYGLVSLSALLSWQTYRRGWVLERVESLPAGVPVAAFVHTDGGFRRLAAAPSVEVRHPLHPDRGAAGVILRPVAWDTFAPREFP